MTETVVSVPAAGAAVTVYRVVTPAVNWGELLPWKTPPTMRDS